MMQIALTGASGFIGSVIARQAAEHGYAVTALVRTNSNQEHIEPYIDRFVTGSHDDPKAISVLIESADVVIHSSFDWKALHEEDTSEHLSCNLQGSIRLLEASNTRHFIYISTIAVHHFMLEKWNGTIDESHPPRPGSHYGACKASVEAHLWAAHASRKQPVTAIRPCAVYGIDPDLSRSIGWPIIESVRNGEHFTREGGGKFVHVDDVAAAVVACVNNQSASPRVYNLVDCYARWADWASMAAGVLKCTIEIDKSSPQEPANTFDTSLVTNELGVSLNRGIEGIRTQIKDLVTRSNS